MQESNLPATRNMALSIQRPEWTEDEKAIMMQTVANGLSVPEFKLFMYSAAALRLNPLAKQIYPVKYKSRMVLIVGIDGFLKHANESGKFRGFEEPLLGVRDSKNEFKVIPHREYDPEEHRVVSATVGIRHADDPSPTWVTVTFVEYAVSFNGELSERWVKAPARQLIKCGEALAIRERFPGMGGEIYVMEEMGHAQHDNGAVDVEFETVGDASDSQSGTQQQGEQASKGRGRPRKLQTPIPPEGASTQITQPEEVDSQGTSKSPQNAQTTSLEPVKPQNAQQITVAGQIEKIAKAFKDTNMKAYEAAIQLCCEQFGVSSPDEIPEEKAEELQAYQRKEMSKALREAGLL